ncbi:MAG: hypothetical protein ACR2JU_10615 [Nocardioidaceae bacterium]
MVTGGVYVDLRADDDGDRHHLDVLRRCPDGAVVRVDVGARWVVTLDAATWLHDHHARLNLVIEGTDPVVVRRWVDAARIGLAWGGVTAS